MLPSSPLRMSALRPRVPRVSREETAAGDYITVVLATPGVMAPTIRLPPLNLVVARMVERMVDRMAARMVERMVERTVERTEVAEMPRAPAVRGIPRTRAATRLLPRRLRHPAGRRNENGYLSNGNFSKVVTVAASRGRHCGCERGLGKFRHRQRGKLWP